MTAESQMLPTPTEMIAHLDRRVRGQERAKQDVAVAVYNHYLSQAHRDLHGEDLGRHHILLIGPTGVGKTHIIKTLAAYLDVPVGFAGATGLVEMGYKGNSVENIVHSLLDRAGNNPRQAEKGIVFLDEIDKIRRRDGGGRDVGGESVQNELLTLLDGRLIAGTESMRHAPVDTGRLLFICTGAFVGLAGVVEKRLDNDARIGFRSRDRNAMEHAPDSGTYAALCRAETDDLVAFGMIPEFVGRFATVTVLHDLSETDLRAIAGGDIDRSPLALQQRLAAVHGIELDFDNTVLDAVARDAFNLGTGARGLHRLIGRAVDAVDFRWSELADGGITRVVITPECIDGGEPELIVADRIRPRIDQELRHAAFSGLPRSPRPVHVAVKSGAAGSASEFSDTRNLTEEELLNTVEKIKAEDLDWEQETGSARDWWQAFEDENSNRPELILRVVEELRKRDATIAEFFLAYVYSNTDNIQANLHYLDYMRVKAADEQPEN